MKIKTAMMCREAYNGNCTEDCEHSHPHEINSGCAALCQKKEIQTECIEIEYPVRE